jgi:hypothetical protein
VELLLHHARVRYDLYPTSKEQARFRATFVAVHARRERSPREIRQRPPQEQHADRALEGDPESTPQTVRLNSPMQGTVADGLRRTLALLRERRTECLEAVLVLMAHSEFPVEYTEA